MDAVWLLHGQRSENIIFIVVFALFWRVFQRKKRWHLGRGPDGGAHSATWSCHAKSGPGGPLLAAQIGPGCQKWSGYINLQETVRVGPISICSRSKDHERAVVVCAIPGQQTESPRGAAGTRALYSHKRGP